MLIKNLKPLEYTEKLKTAGLTLTDLPALCHIAFWSSAKVCVYFLCACAEIEGNQGGLHWGSLLTDCVGTHWRRRFLTVSLSS